MSLLIAILPGILAFFVALALFTLHRDGHLRPAATWTCLQSSSTTASRATGVTSNWTPLTSPTALIARTAFWGCVLLGLIIGVSAFDASFASAATLPISLLPYLTHAVGAILLLIAGTLIARFLARSVLIGAVNAQLQYARFLSLGVKWLVLVLTAAMVLEHLEIGGGVVLSWPSASSSAASCSRWLSPWASAPATWSAARWRATWNAQGITTRNRQRPVPANPSGTSE